MPTEQQCALWAIHNIAWEAPAVTKEITAEVFAQLSVVIEAGTDVAEQMIKTGAVTPPCLDPSIEQQAAALYNYIPAKLIPVEPDDRPTIETFKIGREKLLAALKQSTPPSVLAKIGDTSGADASGPEGGMNWWVLALSTGGLLSWIGKGKTIASLVTLANPTRLVLALAAGLFYALAAYGAITAVLPATKKLIDDIVQHAVVNPIKTAGSVLGIVLGVGIAGVAAVLLFNFARSQNTKQSESRAIAA